MKMYDLSRPSAACAATEFARFPVEAQATVSKPNSRAFVTATDTTRSLNDHVGWQTEPCFTQISRHPRCLPRLRARISGVQPTCWPTPPRPSIGRRSLYRPLLVGPAALQSQLTPPSSAAV